MTTLTFNRETVLSTNGRAAPGLLGRVKSYLARSRAERQLSLLDDRLLADIGMKRAEIHRMVWGN